MREPGNLSIRRFTPEDGPGILALFKATFGSPMAPDQWRWQFLDNPFSRPVVWVAQAPDGGLVGHYSLVPVPFLRDGAKETAAYSILSMIRPDHQRRGILRALAAAAESQLAEDGIRAVATFLNDNSFPVYTSQLGWTEVEGGLPVHFRVLDPARVAGRIGGLLRPLTRLVFAPEPSAAVRVSESSRFDPRMDGLWTAFSKDVRFSIDRGACYLNWRLARSPRPYRILFAEEGERLLGVAAGRVDEKFGQRLGYVVDLVFDPLRPEAGAALLERLAQGFLEDGCGMMTALSPQGPILRVLRRAGFRPLPRLLTPHPIHFCVRDRSGRGAELARGRDWHLAWSDHDVA